MANWRNIFSHRIQTYNSHVWLWDRVGGVAVKVPVPKRPWTGINPDFTHWMAAGGDESPDYIPDAPTGFADSASFTSTTTSTTILSDTVEELMKTLRAAGVVDDDDEEDLAFADDDDDYYDDDDDF